MTSSGGMRSHATNWGDLQTLPRGQQRPVVGTRLLIVGVQDVALMQARRSTLWSHAFDSRPMTAELPPATSQVGWPDSSSGMVYAFAASFISLASSSAVTSMTCFRVFEAWVTALSNALSSVGSPTTIKAASLALSSSADSWSSS